MHSQEAHVGLCCACGQIQPYLVNPGCCSYASLCLCEWGPRWPLRIMAGMSVPLAWHKDWPSLVTHNPWGFISLRGWWQLSVSFNLGVKTGLPSTMSYVSWVFLRHWSSSLGLVLYHMTKLLSISDWNSKAFFWSTSTSRMTSLLSTLEPFRSVTS